MSNFPSFDWRFASVGRWLIHWRERIADLPLEWITAIAVGVFGLIFVAVVPPMQGADESNHFLRVYQISEGDVVSDYVGQSRGGIATSLQTFSHNVGGELPSSVVDFTFDAFNRIPQHSDQKTSWHDLRRLSHYGSQPSRSAAAFGNTAAYSPLAYAPQLVGVWLGRIFGASPLMLLYLARLGSVVAGCVATYWIIRLMPFGKLITAIILLLPTTISQFSIVTADTMTIALGFLVVALTLRLIHSSQNPNNRDIAILIGMYAWLGFVKPSLLPLAFLSFALVTNRAIGRRKALTIACTCLAATVICALAWNGLVKNLVISGFQLSYPASSYATQLHYIVFHPWSYIIVLLNTFLTANANYTAVSSVGYLGWADTPLPLLIVGAGFMLVGIAAYLTALHDRQSLPRWCSWLAAGCLLLIVVVATTYMYLFCNAPRNTYVDGIQGRYFIPAFGLLPLLLVHGHKALLPDKLYSVHARRCLYGATALLVVTVCVLLARYYHLPSFLPIA